MALLGDIRRSATVVGLISMTVSWDVIRSALSHLAVRSAVHLEAPISSTIIHWLIRFVLCGFLRCRRETNKKSFFPECFSLSDN